MFRYYSRALLRNQATSSVLQIKQPTCKTDFYLSLLSLFYNDEERTDTISRLSHNEHYKPGCACLSVLSQKGITLIDNHKLRVKAILLLA
ncbi:MAG TPA: hypothetical protein VFN35_15855, partial [Ktedonobacteraceae bacterium]|nr:hypothetical protein [Ktedonobacteraceae bacterium]